MKPGASPSIIFQDHAGDKSVKDQSRFIQHEACIVASVMEDFLLNNPISCLSLENRKKIDVAM